MSRDFKNFKSKIKRINDHVIQFLSSIDFYKITMLQFLLHRFPAVTSRYKYKNRTKGVQNLAKFLNEINEELDWLCTLRFQPFELNYINKNAKFLTIDFDETPTIVALISVSLNNIRVGIPRI